MNNTQRCTIHTWEISRGDNFIILMAFLTITNFLPMIVLGSVNF